MSEIKEKTFKHKFDDLFEPTIEALNKLGGSGSNDEIEEKIIEILDLTDDEINDVQEGKNHTTKLKSRLSFAKSYLKGFDLCENPTIGIWVLTKKAKSEKINKEEIKKFVRAKNTDNTTDNKYTANEEEIISSNEDSEFLWKEELLEIIKTITPKAFEKLCQRLLRELGFINVEVTQYSKDGGIDGKDVIKLGGIVSFHVVFQAKRYRNSVTSSTVREFRGAMANKADKGLIITTGTFTRDAKKAAHGDGVLEIDLIDGNDFVEKLKDLQLGVDITLVEKVTINKEWFERF